MNKENIAEITSENNPTEQWRWKMMRKVADYIHQPDDVTMSELKAMIESYRSYYNIKQVISNNSSQAY